MIGVTLTGKAYFENDTSNNYSSLTVTFLPIERNDVLNEAVVGPRYTKYGFV